MEILYECNNSNDNDATPGSFLRLVFFHPDRKTNGQETIECEHNYCPVRVVGKIIDYEKHHLKIQNIKKNVPNPIKFVRIGNTN